MSVTPRQRTRFRGLGFTDDMIVTMCRYWDRAFWTGALCGVAFSLVIFGLSRA